METKWRSVCGLMPVSPEWYIWKTFVTCGYCHVVGTVGWYERYTLVRFGTFKSKGSHMFSLDLNSSLFALAGSFIQGSYLANIICHFLSASLWSLVGSLGGLWPRFGRGITTMCSLYNTQLLAHLSNTPVVGTALQMHEAASGDDMDITGNQGHTCHSRWYCLVPLVDEDKLFPLHSNSKE